jgi:ABC-type transporter Mla MlaB component
VGIFSLFGKKDRQQAKSAQKDASRTVRSATGARSDGGKSGGRTTTIKRDAQAALATALKIDAIESEMSSEFVNVTTTQAGAAKSPAKPAPRPANKAKPVPAPQEKPRAPQKQEAKPEPMLSVASATVPEFGESTEYLLNGQSAVADMAAPSSEAAAVIEEAAIMYANGQNDVVEQMLCGAIEEDRLGSVAIHVWLMLFDLYRMTGKQEAFDNLAIAYLNKFETSPPAWTDGIQHESQQAAPTGAMPMVAFSGKLNAECKRQAERIRKLAENYHSLRLEFVRVTEVDPAGCGVLLCVLQKLQKTGHDLLLVGASELADKIRAIIEVGRRDDSEDAWLLLLELLRLLNREKDFEEISIDYCVTFEVSPPAFTTPQSGVTTASAEATSPTPEAEGFLLPPIVEGRIDDLIVAIAAYSDEHDPAIIDCSQLCRVDFNAAGRLLTGLAPFCGVGKVIEFHHVNHLVAELLNVIGLKDIVRIFPRKN